MIALLRRWQWTPSTIVDALLVLALTVYMQQNVWFLEGPDLTFADRPVSSALMGLLTVAFWWRRKAPLLVAVVVVSTLLLQTAVTGTFTNSPAIALCIVIAIYSLGAYTRWRPAVVTASVIATAIWARGAIAPEAVPDTSPYGPLFWWLLVITILGLGMLVRSRRRAIDLNERARTLAHERADHVHAAVAEERSRIARELHDVVSHNVSASILQAEAARALLRSEPHRADQSLMVIQSLGREALAEMRHMLGIIHAESHNGAAPPQPRLNELPVLVERLSEQGAPVTFAIQGTARPVAPGIELSAYRIVQESLTNSRKHAGSVPVHVTLAYDRSVLDVTIVDDGPTEPLTQDDGTGHGIPGMRERVELFGGTFTAGPCLTGGYSVRARFPLSPAEQ
jgi:signal transduction histidine kinase